MTGLWIMIGIGLVLILVFGGALLGLAVNPADEQLQEPGPEPRPANLVSFQPVAFNSEGQQVTVEQIVRDIEQHLRHEGEAAAAFARDPSLNMLRRQ